MVIHGGFNGELNQSINGSDDKYIFEVTFEDLRSQIDIGEGETIPTLDEILSEFAGTSLLLNIELKAPMDSNIAQRYNYQLAARIVCDMISKYRVAHQTMISSFTPEVITAVNLASQGRRDFIVQSLRNFNLEPDPADYEIEQDACHGVNIVYSQLTRALI